VNPRLPEHRHAHSALVQLAGIVAAAAVTTAATVGLATVEAPDLAASGMPAGHIAADAGGVPLTSVPGALIGLGGGVAAVALIYAIHWLHRWSDRRYIRRLANELYPVHRRALRDTARAARNPGQPDIQVSQNTDGLLFPPRRLSPGELEAIEERWRASGPPPGAPASWRRTRPDPGTARPTMALRRMDEPPRVMPPVRRGPDARTQEMPPVSSPVDDSPTTPLPAVPPARPGT
jgi:hypothetical protein